MLKLSFLVVPISFILGLWWYLYENEKLPPQLTPKPRVLHVLSQPSTVSHQFLELFSTQYEVQIKHIETKDDNEFFKILENDTKNIDVIFLKSFHLERTLQVCDVYELNSKTVPNIENISPDFIIEASSYIKFAPIAWGVNGFVINTKEISPPLSLKSILSTKKIKIALSPDFNELLLTTIKIDERIPDWLIEKKYDLVRTEINKLSKQVLIEEGDTFENLLKGDISVKQTTNGQAANFLAQNKDYKFITAIENSTLWQDLLAIPKDSPSPDLAQKLVNFALSHDGNLKIINSGDKASPLKSSAEAKDLLPEKKASYLRQLVISEIDFPKSIVTF